MKCKPLSKFQNGKFKCQNQVQVALRYNDSALLLCGMLNKQQTCEMMNPNDNTKIQSLSSAEIIVQRLVSQRELTITQPFVSNNSLFYYNNNEDQNLVWRHDIRTSKLLASPTTSYVDGKETHSFNNKFIR